MTSRAQIKANRLNAIRSTGPKTGSGKSRVANNALRHGLAIPITSLSALDPRVEDLAHFFADPASGPEQLELAKRVAEASVDGSRVRAAKLSLLERWELFRENQPAVAILDTADGREHPQRSVVYQEIIRELQLGRYERRTLSRLKFAIRAFDAPVPVGAK